MVVRRIRLERLFGARRGLQFLSAWILVLATHAGAETLSAGQNSLPHEQLSLLGDGVILEQLPAPEVTEPSSWIGRSQGQYQFLYVAGKQEGEQQSLKMTSRDPAHPELAWSRHVGENIIEDVEIENSRAIRVRTETDTASGYRVEISPGMEIPAGVKQGDEWQSENRLDVYKLDNPEEVAHEGKMKVQTRYLGSWRVKVPAGEFDAILLEEQFEIEIGLLKASDVRHVFYARHVGLVAEVEALRASALLVFRKKQKGAKVLVDYPAS